MSDDNIQSLLSEERSFPPPAAFAKSANAADASICENAKDIPGFWEEQAKEFAWFKPWHEVLEWDLPFARWFVGGKTNLASNCLDRHVEAGLGDEVACYFEGEPGDRRMRTYSDVLREDYRADEQ